MLLAGCSLHGATKKAEINLNSNSQMAQEANSQAATANNAVKSDSAAAPAVEPAQDSSQAEKPTGTSVAASAPQGASSSPAPATNADPTTLKITNQLVNWGFTKTSGRAIDTIVVHSSYNAMGADVHSVEDIINEEWKPAGVSPHYVIGRDGTIYRLVADQNIAYHAGVSKMPDSRTNVNNFSLGIEVVEAMSESPSSAQYASLKNLIDYLKGKYQIKHVLGHSDIAPGRKTDPWNFDWSKVGGKEK